MVGDPWQASTQSAGNGVVALTTPQTGKRASSCNLSRIVITKLCKLGHFDTFIVILVDTLNFTLGWRRTNECQPIVKNNMGTLG